MTSIQYTTLDRLPALLDRSPEHVLVARGQYPAISVPRAGFDPNASTGMPVVTVYDVKGCIEIERNRRTSVPRLHFQQPSPFASTEMVRRRRLLRDTVMARHGRMLRLPKEKGRIGRDSLHAELSYQGGSLPDLPVVPFVVHVRIHDSEEALRLFSSQELDQDALASIAETIAERVAEMDARLEPIVAEVVHGWRTVLTDRLDAIEPDYRQTFVIALQQRMSRAVAVLAGERKVAIGLGRELDRIATEASTAASRAASRIAFERKTGFDRYPSQFPLARSLGRRIVFHAGPTNSGKTHAALALAGQAATAQILSPLRLLALEHRDAMAAAGVDAGLVTGEERENETGTHIARTIETVELGREVDVAVIDEIQMLGDPSRGWAWTQALIGVPARLVILTGSAEAIPIVERIVQSLGEPLEIKRFERKNRLEALPDPVALRNLRKGDALIAFSRREVHEYRDLLRDSGFSVAALYGALGPEVRRSEAARFREGRADVIVATDAIGMGLNLPIARVVFSTTSKFDGVKTGPLTSSAILQIAGRAGRYGHFDAGQVAMLKGKDARDGMQRIDQALEHGAEQLSGKAYVRPNLASIRAAAELLETDSLLAILKYLWQSLVRNHPDLRMSDLADDLSKAGRIDSLPLAIEARYAYVLTPIAMRSPVPLNRLMSWGHAHARDGEVPPFAPPATGTLEDMETQAGICTAWLWLAQRFKEVYRDADDVRRALADLNAAIESRLARTSGERLQRHRHELRMPKDPDTDLEIISP